MLSLDASRTGKRAQSEQEKRRRVSEKVDGRQSTLLTASASEAGTGHRVDTATATTPPVPESTAYVRRPLPEHVAAAAFSDA